MNTPHDRFEAVRSLGAGRVALALGMSADARRGISPCPACGAAQRGSKDKRGPVGLTADGSGWRCHRCDASGDGLTLAAWAITGSRDAAGRWGDVLDRLDPAGHAPPVRRDETPRFPPADEVAALFHDTCTDGFDDPEGRAWLAARSIDAGTAIDRGLFRVLPAGATVPRWAWGPNGAWSAAGYRLLVPLYGLTGTLVTVRARRVGPGEGPKSLPPAGFSVAGCVMADPLGRLLLQQPDEAAELLTPRGPAPLVVCEGEPDFLFLATAAGDTEAAPAVLGIVAGSWTPELAARVPRGATVILDTDRDRNGDHYAAGVRRSLPHCNVRRTHAENHP